MSGFVCTCSVLYSESRHNPRKEILVGSQNAWDAAEGFGCTGVVTSKMLKGQGGKALGRSTSNF